MFPENIEGSTLELFYMFVDVLLSNSRKDRSRFWLAENLKADCPKLTDEMIAEYCDIYDHLKGFKNVWKGQLARQIVISLHEENMTRVRTQYGNGGSKESEVTES